MSNYLIFVLSSALGKSWNSSAQIDFSACLSLAMAHGVAPMLYYALPALPEGLLPDENFRSVLKKIAYSAATRNAIQDREMAEILDLFRANKLKLLPLKGYVIKKLYPKPDMRQMSDTDLLIDGSQAGQVKACLEGLGFTNNRFDQGDTDIYTSPSGLRYEVHRSLEGEGFNEPSREFLIELLRFAVPSQKDEPILSLPAEEHYVYVLCHFVKHLLSGGIGVRQVMDIFLCRKKWVMDGEKLSGLLKRLELTDFAATVERLANSWFDEAEGNSVTEELGRYILGSGVFGKEQQRITDRMLKEEKSKGKIVYLFSRLFPGYKSMCFYYPVLKKFPFLLPVFWIWRMIYALLFRRKKLLREVGTVNETDSSALRERAAFYRRCGLKVFSDR